MNRGAGQMSSFGSRADDEKSERLDRRSNGRASVIAGLQLKKLQTVIRFLMESYLT
jgi:hypothetical protein